MRIAIDLRILAVGPRAINRGMPRFTQQQLRNVLAIDHDNEYLVLTREGEDLSVVDPAIRTAHNAAICHPTGWSVDEPGHPQTMLRRSAEFQDWLVDRQVDLYHATTPFLFIDPFPLDFDACPMVSTFYDAIPLIYPQRYLPEPFRDAYSCCLAAVLRSDRLLAISGSARRDASVYAGFPRDRIDLVSPIADECFRPLDDRRTWRALATIGERTRIPGNSSCRSAPPTTARTRRPFSGPTPCSTSGCGSGSRWSSAATWTRPVGHWSGRCPTVSASPTT